MSIKKEYMSLFEKITENQIAISKLYEMVISLESKKKYIEKNIEKNTKNINSVLNTFYMLSTTIDKMVEQTVDSVLRNNVGFMKYVESEICGSNDKGDRK